MSHDRPRARSPGGTPASARTRSAGPCAFTSGLRQNHSASASGLTPSSIRRNWPCSSARRTGDVILGPELAVGEVRRARLEAQQFRVLLRDDLEDDAIEVGQRATVRRLPPVARVAFEDEPLSRLVLAQDEGPRACQIGRRRLRVPRRGQRARLQRRLELVLRQDRQDVEQPDARARRPRVRHDDGLRVGRRSADRLTADLQRVGEDAVRPGDRRRPRARTARRPR